MLWQDGGANDTNLACSLTLDRKGEVRLSAKPEIDVRDERPLVLHQLLEPGLVRVGDRRCVLDGPRVCHKASRPVDHSDVDEGGAGQAQLEQDFVQVAVGQGVVQRTAGRRRGLPG